MLKIKMLKIKMILADFTNSRLINKNVKKKCKK